jgi:ferredoxin
MHRSVILTRSRASANAAAPTAHTAAAAIRARLQLLCVSRRRPVRTLAAATTSDQPWLAPGNVRFPKRDDKMNFYQQNAQADPSQLRQPRAENAPGAFFVDRTCIDCSTCRWIAPESFTAVGLQAAVTAQPATREGRVAALQALLSCPTHSIHARERSADELREAQAGLPRPWPTAVPAGGVYHCGWHSNDSYGGAGWLLVRPQGGNILIDSPRFSPGLAKNIEALGGVSWIFLTHK